MTDIAASHQNRLGCSEIAAAIGVSPWMTPYQLWEIKTGRATPPDLSGDLRIKLGHRLEDVVADLYTAQTGFRLEGAQSEFVGDMGGAPVIGHIDRKVLGEQRGVEIKTSLSRFSGRDWGCEDTDEIPMHYLVQCLGYLMLTGWERWDVAVLLAGPELRVYQVQPNQELFDTLESMIGVFWRSVASDTAPDPATHDDANRRWPASIDSALIANAALAAEIEELRAVRETLTPLKERAEAAVLAIKTGMGERERLTDIAGRSLCTWKTTTRQAIDQKALKSAHPEIYQQFLTSTTTRTFRIC